MSGKHWWLALEAIQPGTLPDDCDTRPFRPPVEDGEHHVMSEWAAQRDVDGCNGQVCGWWPCECEGEKAWE